MISRIDIEDMTDAQDEARTLPDTGWLIHKAGRGWYRPNAQGYTSDVAQAGRYSHADAMSYSHPNGWDGPRDEITIKHESEVADLARPSQAGDERVARLVKEYRPTMDAEVLHNWAQDVVAALAAMDTPKGGEDE